MIVHLQNLKSLSQTSLTPAQLRGIHKHSTRRFHKFGFMLLQWLWAVNCFYYCNPAATIALRLRDKAYYSRRLNGSSLESNKVGPNNGGRAKCWFKFGKNGVDAEGAAVYGSQSPDDFDRDDVEEYFNYMGMLMPNNLLTL